VIFQADNDEIELHKNSYDVISVTSSPLHHRKTSQIFSNLPPPPSKFLATPWGGVIARCVCLQRRNSSMTFEALLQALSRGGEAKFINTSLQDILSFFYLF